MVCDLTKKRYGGSMKTQKLHLKAPDNWINDPNGFIYYKGYYHLFYQYFPFGPRWGTMHWGHAVSRDLVSWEHKDMALYPSIREDLNGCFSGSALEKDGKLYLVYTGVRYEVVNPEDPHTCLDDQFESAQIMITSDDGMTFDNKEGKKVIIPPLTDPSVGDRTHTRDPKVWRGTDGWYLILGSMAEGGYGEVLFYKSTDLEHWTYMNKAFKGEGYGWMWECPDYFETDGEEGLILSAMGLLTGEEKEKNQTICFPVSFRETGCEMQIPDTYQFMDYGMDLYAPQTTLDQEGRRVLEAWVRMPEVTDEGWIGMFCTPRIVEMKNGHMYFRMHPNLRAAYEAHGQERPEGEAYMLSFDIEDGETKNIGGFLIKREGSSIVTDRSQVYPSYEGAHLISRTPEIKEGFHLDVIVDPHLVEVFINDGEYVISNAVCGIK